MTSAHISADETEWPSGLVSGQGSDSLAEWGTGALWLSREAGYQINKASGRVPNSTLAHIGKHGLSPYSRLVPAGFWPSRTAAIGAPPVLQARP